VGAGVASVQLSVGGAAVDAMTPNSGVVVLSATGDAGLDGASVIGLDQSGATIESVPAGQVAVPDTTTDCPAPASTPAPPTTTGPTTATTTTTSPTTATTTTP
jgi:hypothetical protein